MALIRGGAVTFSSLADACPFRPTRRAPDPRKSTGTIVVGVCSFSSRLRGLELVPEKWRCLVPPTSG